jgi:TRAP-type mannitol/chloroaromatic compound transport system permease small subunit
MPVWGGANGRAGIRESIEGGKQDAAAVNRPWRGKIVNALLKLSGVIDRINEKLGFVTNLLVLLSVIVSAGNAMSRYAFNLSSNGWLEVQWYMFAVVVMYGASYTLRRNEHVRVEIFYLMLSERAQLWLDLICTVLFLVPVCLLLAYLSWPFFRLSYETAEVSGNAGGLIRWPIKFVLPSGFVLLALQGVSEIIKRIAAIQGLAKVDAHYERPLQ